MRVLVVEDERKVADALREGLEAEHYEVTVERTGDAASERLLVEAFDLILLDLTLPGRDGIEVLHAFRRRSTVTPVLILSARDSVQERVAGLDAGADDYVIKPFAFGELLARIRALSRRTTSDWTQVRVGTLLIERPTRAVFRNDRRVELTHKEYELLEYLARYHGQVVSREALAREVWQETFRSTTLDNVIDVHIARLRRKVDTEHPRLIHTIKGVGFLLREGGPE